MIWLSWRQFRAQALIGGALLIIVAAAGLVVGNGIRQTYDAYVGCTGCTLENARQVLDTHYRIVVQFLGFLVIVAPALVGAFWGAPLIARELETGSHRLVWSQSIPRLRWLTARLGLVLLAGLLLAAAISLLVGWAVKPYDDVMGGRFAPFTFSMRGIVPLGYAAFAVVVGVTVGLLTRRTVLSMAITIAAFVLLQLVVPGYLRAHYEPPVTRTVQLTPEVFGRIDGIGGGPDGVEVRGYAPSGSWALTPESPLLTASGKAVTQQQIRACLSSDPRADQACMTRMDLHFTISYHPADRYWRFQMIETGGYLALAALLTGFLYWRIPRGVS